MELASSVNYNVLLHAQMIIMEMLSIMFALCVMLPAISAPVLTLINVLDAMTGICYLDQLVKPDVDKANTLV